jgi:hypothetical protein
MMWPIISPRRQSTVRLESDFSPMNQPSVNALNDVGKEYRSPLSDNVRLESEFAAHKPAVNRTL